MLLLIFVKHFIEEMYIYIITLFKRNGLYLKFKTVLRNFTAFLNDEFSNTE